MKFIRTPYNVMPFNQNIDYDWGGYFIGFSDNHDQWIKKMSYHSFELIRDISLKYNVNSYFRDSIYFYHTSDKIIKRLDIKTFHIDIIGGDLFPKYYWDKYKAFHNLTSRYYEIYDCKGEKLHEFRSDSSLSFLLYPCGILKYHINEKKDNWLVNVNPDNGKEIWRMEFEWKITRVEHNEKYLILNYSAYENIRQDTGYEGQRDWYHPNYYVICIDGETGTEIWKTTGIFFDLNRKFGTVLISDSPKKEIEIASGRVVAQMNESPKNESGAPPHYSDEKHIYYLSNSHEFGKYNKFTGEIIWEFNLIDEKGQKRMLSDWLVLGNGNLVLQTLPNHPDGDFTCIFNPEENMEFSKVKNGVRI